MGVGDTFDFFAYSSDDGTTYGLKLTTTVATAGGFGTRVDPRSTKVWPYGAKNVRYVRGKNTAGNSTRLPIATNADSLYQTGGSFSLKGGTYTAEGAIGERRKLNSIA